MSERLPHVREPSSGEPDVCVHCREDWVDLLTLYETNAIERGEHRRQENE